MRTRYLVLLTISIPIAILLLLRHHVRDLAEVARTYATFHTYLKRHPDVFFRYPPSDTPQESNNNALAPRIIHQIFLSQGHESASIAKYQLAMESCQKLHPAWEVRLWTDEPAREFMAEHYPDIEPHYTGYKQNIQRANILRYALLHHFGGVYLDLDVTCLENLDHLRYLPWLSPGAYPAGVNNAFILTKPGHAFLGQLLNRVPSRDLSWPMPYVENMLSTGCMFFSNVWMAYVRTQEERDDAVYILADEEGNMDPHMLRGKIVTPLFEHGGASSWHGWDAAMIVFVGKHYTYFAVAVVGLLAAGVVVAWRLAGRNKKSRRRPSWRSFSRRSGDRESVDKMRLLGDEERDG